MAANHHHHHKHHQILHEILKQEQEPFHLNTYINTKRSNLQKQKVNNNNTQFLDGLRSTNDPVLIHIPSSTAALLIEAASRIQKHSTDKKRSKDHGFLGSFLKKRAPVKDQRNKKSFALRISDVEEGRDRSSDVGLLESRFCWCSLGFSVKRRNASTFCSSVDYSSSKQDNKIINAHKRSSNVRRDQAESEGNEHSSPTSVLEHFFEDDERESDAAKEDDSHLESSYANVQKVKEKLLKRLRRFEELAELDPMEFDHIHFVEGNTEEEITSKIEENAQNNNSWKVLSTETTNSTGNNKKAFFGGIFKIKNDAIIDMMVELELTSNNGSWRTFNEQVEDVVQVIERDIFELLIDELCERVL